MISRALGALAGCLLLAVLASAKDPLRPFDGGGVEGLTLQQQLELGLRARRPVEFQYIRQVIRLVEKGKLSRKLVVSTYLAAQRQPRHQLQYFQIALEARTVGMDIRLPDLRKQAVGVVVDDSFDGVPSGSTMPLR